MKKKYFFKLEEDKMFQQWSMRQKALVATFFGLVLVAGVTSAFLGGKLKFQASQVLEPYANQAELSYTDSQGQSRTVESNIVKLQLSAPGDTTPPSVPGNLHSTTQTATAISLEWNPSTDNIAVKGYRIFRGVNLVGTVEGSTSYTDMGLNPKTQYTYTVQAFDAVPNFSEPSAPLQVTTQPDTEKPSTPQNFRSTSVTSDSVSLAWDPPTDNVGVGGYILYCDNIPYYYIVGNQTSNTFEGRKPDTTYRFEVSVFDAAINISDRSQPLNVTTTGTEPEAISTTPPVEEQPKAASGTPSTEEQLVSIKIATISGQLVDKKTKQPIAGATISIVDKKNQVISKTTTDKQGKYKLYYKPQEGKFTFKAAKDNYSYTKKNISLSQDQYQTISPEIKKSNWFVSWMRKAASSISGFFKKIF